jgi:hypothetical protein
MNLLQNETLVDTTEEDHFSRFFVHFDIGHSEFFLHVVSEPHGGAADGGGREVFERPHDVLVCDEFRGVACFLEFSPREEYHR